MRREIRRLLIKPLKVGSDSPQLLKNVTQHLLRGRRR